MREPREVKPKPKLAWSGNGWICTLVKLNGDKADRTIKFIRENGEVFTLELSPVKNSVHYVGLKVSWTGKRVANAK